MANVRKKKEERDENRPVYLALGSGDTWSVCSEEYLQDHGNSGRPVFQVDFEGMRLLPVDVLDYTDVDYVLSVQVGGSVPGGSPMAPVGTMVGQHGIPITLRGDDDIPDLSEGVVVGPDGAVAETGSIFRKGTGEQ
jgi:hypothetical protein